ncbi:hypothetical protein [Methylomonas sp. DH-1]|uniref:hypothetical protein n=1 Tax=Methylomonas sp. (strain DH-1) TaxID=1727196 RepID=UPI0012F65310|nr:hypothetical protein [Methylomonas sp. DH-1]
MDISNLRCSLTDDEKHCILFGQYSAGADSPLVGLPAVYRQVESQAAFIARRRIREDIAFLDDLFGPVRPSGFSVSK